VSRLALHHALERRSRPCRFGDRGPELFAVFGATAVAGWVLEPADNQPGHDHVVVLTNRFWHRQFGADRSIVSRTIDNT